MWPFDDILNAFNYLFSFLVALVMVIIYLPVSIINVLWYNIAFEINLIIELVNNLLVVANVVIFDLLGMFTDVYIDSAIGFIMTASVLVVLFYRIYHFVKGLSISVAGFGGSI